MQKYKINRRLVNVICDNCGEIHQKPESEYNRNARMNRHNFCSRSCSVKFCNKYITKEYSTSDKNLENLHRYRENRRTELTPFSYSMRSIRSRYKDYDVDSQYLKEIWDSQNGICPYSGIKLVLPEFNNTNKNDVRYRASVDRIDSSLGYIRGNIQFISTPINYMKNTMSNEDTIEYLKQIADYISNK